MWWRTPYNPTAYDDDWEDQPGQGWFHKWVPGMLLPLALIGYGAYAIVQQQATFGGQSSMHLHGANATAFGIAWVSAGLFLHCHYFWGNIYNQAWFAVFGKIVAASGFIAGLAFVIVRNVVFGMS
jgi:hypothetical protein